jgi:hypothetical protein
MAGRVAAVVFVLLAALVIGVVSSANTQPVITTSIETPVERTDVSGRVRDLDDRARRLQAQQNHIMDRIRSLEQVE